MFTSFEESPRIAKVEPDLRVGFILSPRFSLLPFASFIEGLRHAADEGEHDRQIFCTWTTMASQLQSYHASCGVELRPREHLADPTLFDYVVVVGGHLPECMEHDEETFDYLRRTHALGVGVVGLCTGSFVLAKAGLLTGRRCAVHPEHYQAFRAMFPAVEPSVDELYVEDGGILTCPGGSSALDLIFALIETHCGRARAAKALQSLLYDKRNKGAYLRSLPYGHLADCGNVQVERAYQFMLKNISTPMALVTVGERTGTTGRTLGRLFSRHAGASPSVVWRSLRLAHGKWLLVNSSKTITQIALECGFVDNAHFSKWFKRAFDMSPRRYRTSRHAL